MILVFESFSQHTSIMSERSERYIYNISVYSYSFATSSLASPVHSYGANACLTPIYLFMVLVAFSLPYIVCYRWRELSDITTVGSYSGFRLHSMGAVYNIPVYSYGRLLRHFYSFYFMCSRDFIIIQISI